MCTVKFFLALSCFFNSFTFILVTYVHIFPNRREDKRVRHVWKEKNTIYRNGDVDRLIGLETEKKRKWIGRG